MKWTKIFDMSCAEKVKVSWESRKEDFERFMNDISGATQEEFYEYGLSFDYVDPETFEDHPEGFFRYQLGFGGPTVEIRFFASQGISGWSLYRAEFWYLDWGGGAKIDVTSEETIKWLWQEINETQSTDYAFEKNMKEYT